jgi:aminoglycoside phosphotransferase (APT) family kinase protein
MKLPDPIQFSTITPFVLRLPKQSSLLPYQVVNGVTCLSIISSHSPDVPVPKVHTFAADSPNAFIAEEYVDREILSSCWNHYTEDKKRQVAYRIAQIIVSMGEMRFDGIGGFTSGGADCLLGSTVEGSKLFKGQVSS